MTTYHILIETKDEEIKTQIMNALNHVKEDMDFSIKIHEHDDDLGEEAGEFILWYFSDSHKKIRYYVGPPEQMGAKPQWSYEKKDAAKLSKAACEIVSARIFNMGYTTPLKIDKKGATLSVVQGHFGGEVKAGEADSPEEVIAQAGAGEENLHFALDGYDEAADDLEAEEQMEASAYVKEEDDPAQQSSEEAADELMGNGEENGPE